jgi:4-amino-4-deoxy-L-arabinose transferase-like glycosyltransferase
MKREAADPVLRMLTRGAALLACVVLLAVMAATMVAVVRQKGITVDEFVMIPAGYHHLTEGDFRPVSEHPPLAKLAAALPLLFADVEAPRRGSHDLQNSGDYSVLVHDFWRANDERYETIGFWSRVPAIALTVLLGAVVFIYARRYWGTRAALFAVALFTLEPTVLAHGRVAQTDIPSALGFLVLSFTSFEYFRTPSSLRAAFVGLAFGLAAVTKFSMIALGPVLMLLWLGLLIVAPNRGLRRTHLVAQAIPLALAALLAINAAYFFQLGRPVPSRGSVSRLVIPASLEEPLSGLSDIADRVLRPSLPPQFVSGIALQFDHVVKGHRAGLLGQYGTDGWWYYFPVAFALKTTLPFLVVSAAAVWWALRRLRTAPEGRLLILLLPVMLFTTLLMLSPINIGVRYYLPAYPFLFILGGAFLDGVVHRYRRHAMRVSMMLVAVFSWIAAEAVRAYPDHMTYMNQLARNAPHWWYLSDSNVEWGDDVRGLARYLRARGEQRVGCALLNAQALERYGIERTSIMVGPGHRPEGTRYIAIGASFLNGSTVPDRLDNGVILSEAQRVHHFDEFRRRQPETVFGNSIYLYRVTE